MRTNRRLLCAVGCTAGLLLLAALSFFVFDKWAAEHFGRSNDFFIHNFWIDAFHQLGNSWVQIWLLLLWTWLVRKPKVFVIAVTGLILVSALVWSLKFVTARPRPREVGQTTEQMWNEKSFPSGDTASAFTVAIVAAAFTPWGWKVALILAAFAIGFLRVAVHAHYPSDVLAGAGVGILCGVLAPYLADRLRWDWREMREKKWTWPPPAGLVLIPILIQITESDNYLLTFLKAYGLPILVLCLWYLWQRRTKQTV